MNDLTSYLPVESLKRFTVDVFRCAGVSLPDAEICADVILASDLRGIESHGISRLSTYYLGLQTGRHSPSTHIEMVQESPTTAVLDAHCSLGQVVGVRAMALAIDKARQSGLGAVAVRNSSHFGIDGYYVGLAVQAGMIGMSFTNARPSVAPTFAVAPMLGTNPIAFGAPSDEECPFLFDASTAIVQRGKIEVYAREGKTLPEGWVIDRQGGSPTDAVQANDGFAEGLNALQPLGGAGELLGGHKGYGLSTMVEILCTALSQNAFMHHLPGGAGLPAQVGHFFLAVDIERFTPLDSFKATVGNILRELRAAPKAPGQERIYTAGEKEFEMEKLLRERGIPVSAELQKELKALQAQLGLTQYDDLFPQAADLNQ